MHLPRYRFWPNEKCAPGGLRLQIGWLNKRFDLVDSGTITTRFSSQRRPVPWVRLRDEATGPPFVIDVHNSPGDQEADRDSATRKQIRLITRLRERKGQFGWRGYQAEPVKVSDHRLHSATFRWPALTAQTRTARTRQSQAISPASPIR